MVVRFAVGPRFVKEGRDDGMACGDDDAEKCGLGFGRKASSPSCLLAVEGRTEKVVTSNVYPNATSRERRSWIWCIREMRHNANIARQKHGIDSNKGRPP